MKYKIKDINKKVDNICHVRECSDEEYKDWIESLGCPECGDTFDYSGSELCNECIEILKLDEIEFISRNKSIVEDENQVQSQNIVNNEIVSDDEENPTIQYEYVESKNGFDYFRRLDTNEIVVFNHETNDTEPCNHVISKPSIFKNIVNFFS